MNGLLFVRKYNHFQSPYGHFKNVELHLGHYGNGQLAIQLSCAMDDEPDVQEPLMTASVCMVNQPIPANAVWVKDYSENEGVLAWLIQNGVIEQEACAIASAGYASVTAHHLTARFLLEVGDALNRTSSRQTAEQFLKSHAE